MQLFIDSADISEIRKLNALGIIDGVTTNPSLIAKQSLPFKELAKLICEEVNGPVSFEALSVNSDDMLKEAIELNKIHKNVVVKIPCTAEGLKAIKLCKEKNIKTNCTLIFNAVQALLAAKAGATFVSPFVGRLDDIAENGMQVVKDIMLIFHNYNIQTKVIVASIRHPMHVIEAARIGADIATVPPNVLESLLKHPKTDEGIAKFMADWEKFKEKF